MADHTVTKRSRKYPLIHGQPLHRWRAEQALGHPLPPGAEVHHVDGNIDDEHSRLVICPDHAYHRLLHRRTRIRQAGGNPNTDKMCGYCLKPRPLTEFSSARSPYCRPCWAIYQRNRRKGLDECRTMTFMDELRRLEEEAAILFGQIDNPEAETDTND